MSQGERIPFEVAYCAAHLVRQALARTCERIEVAGSVRRRCRTVGDLELVCIARRGLNEIPGELFPREASLLWARVLELEAAGKVVLRKRPREDARQLRLFVDDVGLTIELYCVTPETWGVQYLIRTGSGGEQGFAAEMTRRWRSVSRGGLCRDGRLRYTSGEMVGTPQEQDVFRACRVDWIDPPDRRDASVVRRAVRRRNR